MRRFNFLKMMIASAALIFCFGGCSKAEGPHYEIPEKNENEGNKKPIVSRKEFKQAVKVVGDQLYIGAKYNPDYDLLITFSHCMYNKLMTFSQVGLASNKSKYPMDNPDRPVEAMLNQAFSDNIGPFGINGHGWCGANHSYMDQNQVHTAECLDFTFMADGKLLKDGDCKQVKKVQVKVKNRIFNPMVAPSPGDNILSSELCIEEVEYLIENGSIYVNARHTFTNAEPVSIYAYYGMQSMFWNETHIMTPQGLLKDFTEKGQKEDVTFHKGDYPDFRRFIERREQVDPTGPKGKKLYQSTYLLPEKNGKHDMLTDNNRIFTHSWGKCYHVLLEGISASAGMKTEWCGIYNWPEPLQDNENALVYTARAKGKDYLFIDVKKAAKGLKAGFPEYLRGRGYTIFEKAGDITRIEESKEHTHLTLHSSGSGSVVLVFQ